MVEKKTEQDQWGSNACMVLMWVFILISLITMFATESLVAPIYFALLAIFFAVVRLK